MNEDNPDFWEWVKNKIREREQQQQPLQIEIQIPLPSTSPPSRSDNEMDGIYENVNHEIKTDILQF